MVARCEHASDADMRLPDCSAAAWIEICDADDAILDAAITMFGCNQDARGAYAADAAVSVPSTSIAMRRTFGIVAPVVSVQPGLSTLDERESVMELYRLGAMVCFRYSQLGFKCSAFRFNGTTIKSWPLNILGILFCDDHVLQSVGDVVAYACEWNHRWRIICQSNDVI